MSDYVPDAINADTAIVRPVWSILNKGKTGTGKSILSCGKQFRPTYFFNLEGRMESVLTYYKRLDGHLKDLHYNDYNMGTGFHPLDKKMDSIIARPEYQTVVVASLTSYVHIILQHLMRATSGPNKDNKRDSRRMKGGIQVNILEDYNFEDAAIIFELCNFLQTLKGMGVNVILEAHITPYEIKTINEDTGQREATTIMEILTKGKKAPAQIPGYFNEVWLSEKYYEGDWSTGEGRKPRYRVNTSGTPTDECKTSFGIPTFEWTNIDPTEKLMSFLNPEIKDTPRVDPNAPKRVSW